MLAPYEDQDADGPASHFARWLEGKGLSVSRVAAEAGVSRGTLSRYLSGKTTHLSGSTERKLAGAFGERRSALFGAAVEQDHGETIRVARVAVGLSQGELAEKLGITAGVVSRWEAGLSRSWRRYSGQLATILKLDALPADDVGLAGPRPDAVSRGRALAVANRYRERGVALVTQIQQCTQPGLAEELCELAAAWLSLAEVAARRMAVDRYATLDNE